MTSPTPPTADGEVLITRTFRAPRQLVWQAWTDRAHLTRWHAPQGCDIHFARFDFRVGGSFHSRISNPSFGDCWCLGTYLEIVPPERLVYTMALADAAGHLIAAEEAGHDPEWPAETTVTLTLTEQADGSTLLTLHQSVKESIARRTGAYPSWLSMFDRLAEDLANL